MTQKIVPLTPEKNFWGVVPTEKNLYYQNKRARTNCAYNSISDKHYKTKHVAYLPFQTPVKVLILRPRTLGVAITHKVRMEAHPRFLTNKVAGVSAG